MSYNEFVRRFLTVVAIVLLLLLFWRLRTVLMMIFLASIIAVSLDIPAKRFRELGMNRGPAIILTLLLIISLVFLFLAWILPTLVVQMAEIIGQFPDAYESVRQDYQTWYWSQTSTVRGFMPTLSSDNEQVEQLVNDLTAFAPPLAANIGNALASSLANMGIIVVVAIFMLLEPKNYAVGLITIMPPSYRDRVLEILVELRITVTTWMTALTFSVTVTALLVWVILGGLIGIPNALALGVIAGVATIIPNLGAIIPLIPITIFTLADDPAKLPLAIPAYLVVQLLESNVLTPSIVKRELNIPAAIVLLFQLVAAYLLGFFGVLLAVPLLAVMITLIRELYVYDILGMRGVKIDIEGTGDGGLKLVTQRRTDAQTLQVMTQTFRPMQDVGKSSREEFKIEQHLDTVEIKLPQEVQDEFSHRDDE